MIDRLQQRAANANLLHPIEARMAPGQTMGVNELGGQIDLSLA